MNSKLKWLCRRGMKELDLVMESYLLNDFPKESEIKQQAFIRLLAYEDPVILDLLFSKREDEDTEIQMLIEDLKRYQPQSLC